MPSSRPRLLLIRLTFALTAFVLAAFVLTACAGQAPAQEPAQGRLHVAATTTLLGDVVRVVGGEAIDLVVLLPPGAEPHSYQLSPRDVAGLEEADLVFVNGFGLEEALMPTLESVVANEKIVSVSQGVEAIDLAGGDNREGGEHGLDPHTWTDPNNVSIWADNIAAALAAADPAQRPAYHARAEAYKRELAALDGWIRAQVAQIPEGKRKLVSDHAVFGYFARRYGLEQAGAIIPGFSALSEPSARELAALEDAIRALGVGAIFVGNTLNPALAEAVAEDTHTRVLFVFSDSLSAADGPAATYLDFMRYDVSVFVDGLR